MNRRRIITVTEKLTGLAIAILVVGGLSSVVGSLLNTSETRRDFEFVALNEAVDPLMRVEAVEDRDFVFHSRQFMDERSAEALERAMEYGLAQLEKVMSLHENRLASLEEYLEEIEEIERIPEPLREEMRVEVALEIRRAEREVRRVLAEVRRLHVEKAAAAVRAREIPERAAPPKPPAFPLPHVTPERQACDQNEEKPKEKGSKDGKEGFMEALSFV
ncbi:hypothetical protein [Emcibacter sp.]|uniref:hypothetical protein n=1 Tax=Emcibacter sp. TaxID=1979954 RepID=UPI003A91B927